MTEISYTQLIDKGWRTPDTYDKDFAPLPKGSGIYILVLADWKGPKITHRILYIGMSTNIEKRFKNHEVLDLCAERSDSNQAVKIFFKRYPRRCLRTRERRLIKLYNPPYNLQHRERGI